MTDFHHRQVGRDGSSLLVIDACTGDAGQVAEIAAALAPFPPARGNSYPGVRRFITPADRAAVEYSGGLLRRVAPAVNAVFGADGFDLLSASFSLVTARPALLEPIQRAPHFDSTDPHYLAILHYVGGTGGSGTGFYRQRSTGIERVTAANSASFVAAARREAAGWHGYISGSTSSFDRIDAVEAVDDRVIVYPGSLLHSGIIPDTMAFSDDPSLGRLTANFFVRMRPRGATSAG